jgi:hypothetical protein
MSEELEKSQKEAAPEKSIMFPAGWPEEVFQKVQRDLKNPERQRSLVFENEKQRNAMAIRKGLTKPGQVSYDTLRRIAMSVYVARICINSLKAKVTKTKWVIQPTDQTKRKKSGTTDKRIKELEEFFKHPNQSQDTFRTLLDKMCEDLLVLDAVSLEKTRYIDGTLAELHFVDSATIRPVFDEHGNQDVVVPLMTESGEENLPVSYLQILNNSQYGGPESGDIQAAWPKKDFIYFHMNPQGSMESFGYGLSPLEGVLSVVSNLLNSDNYNSTYFEEGAFPPVLLNIVGKINQRDIEAFKQYFYQELNGNFHRPALLASENKSEVINLKEFTNRDMQFMEYTLFLAKMLCAAYGMSAEDIGLTDTTGSKSVSEVQKDISQQKGYSSILDLFKQIFNQEIIQKDFGYDDLEFEWVADDSLEPDIASQVHDRSLKNGSLTLNEVRQKQGDTPYGAWADKPMLLTADGFIPLLAEGDDEEGTADVVDGKKPYKDQDDVEGEEITKVQKSVLTPMGYKVWADDRGTAQPFIYMDVKTGLGTVIKPPIAVNLQSQELEITLTNQLAGMGLNVKPMRKMSFVEVTRMLAETPELLIEFEKYCSMSPEYDSEKWKVKYGGSRKFSYYLVSEYIDGYSLNNPLMLADMKRDPESYKLAINDLANLWKVEKEMVLGDRRADQYIIGRDKRAYGIDYQFQGDQKRWDKTQDAICEALEIIPELHDLFEAQKETKLFSMKSILQALNKKFKGGV